MSETLTIDDKVLKEIIGSLYYPAPYEFAVLPADILGSIYERFLGKIIRMTGVHRVRVEEKPEVRKAGGVYYTPQYIVNYIVENTIGALLQNKTPKTLKNFRIVDPACGSGSFLINAYQYLLDWHLREYVKAPDQYKKQCVKTGERNGTAVYKLSINERKRILTGHIFGVDIDAQAVEVTKLSLLLKALEGLNEQEIQKELFNERVLPDLSRNIKCGNSLIGTGIYAQGTLGLSDDDQYRINAFDWEREFADVFKDGGFDAVIGNPPYGASFSRVEQEYMKNMYRIPNYQYDSYLFFIEKATKLLCNDGYLGFIIPNTWLLNLTAIELRKYIFANIRIEIIEHFMNKVFKDAVVDTEIIIFRNNIPKDNKIQINACNHDTVVSSQQIYQKKLIELNGNPYNIFDKSEYTPLKEKMKLLPKLDSVCKITQGTKPFQVGKGKPPQTKKIVNEKPYVSDKQIDNSFFPLLRGSMMNRYTITWNNDYWIKFGDWLAEPRYSASYELPKIIIRQTGDSLVATYDNEKFIVRDNLYTIVNISEVNISLKYLLGIIDSRFLNWYYQNIINNERGEALAQVKRGHLAILPIPFLDLTKKSDKAAHDKLVSLVDQMLALKKKEQAETVPQTKTMIARQIQAVDTQIDAQVYELYSLTEEEIKVVEGEGG
jgi:type I restriction-modification system DNA methylase subunit